MAQFVGRLTALKVLKTKKPGMYADGAGLYLQVTGDGGAHIAKSWIYRFTLRGRAREMGLGSLSIYGLAEARIKAAECRRMAYEGIDPIEARRSERARAALSIVIIKYDPLPKCLGVIIIVRMVQAQGSLHEVGKCFVRASFNFIFYDFFVRPLFFVESRFT